MCFSATASFAAAAAIGGVGVATLMQRPKPRDMAFAAIPIIFAVHQAIEGAVWLTLEDGTAPYALIVAYLVIAQVLWPAYVPLSIILMEPRGRRRPALWILLAAGLFVSGALAVILTQDRYTVTVVEDGLHYATDREFEHRLLGLYLLATTAPLFLSRQRYVVAFGAATVAGAAVTVIAYFYAAASVWCFFSAMASIFVFLHIRRSRKKDQLSKASTKIAAA